MSAKHTPGPWSVALHNQEPAQVTQNYEPFAHITLTDSGAEELANANLIAAAPELLAALDDLHEQCRRLYVLVGALNDGERDAEVRAALGNAWAVLGRLGRR